MRALTGVDTDRLPEEKARGITIELGFAPLALPSGRRLGVVDVPGHEALVRTMVAGATGIDLVLLVVAADEGRDAADARAPRDLLAARHPRTAWWRSPRTTSRSATSPTLAEAEVRALVDASALAGAPIVRVSAQTGAGLDALRAALDARGSAAPPRARPAAARRASGSTACSRCAASAPW